MDNSTRPEHWSPHGAGNLPPNNRLGFPSILIRNCCCHSLSLWYEMNPGYDYELNPENGYESDEPECSWQPRRITAQTQFFLPSALDRETIRPAKSVVLHERRQPQLVGPPVPNLHIPRPILAKIVSYVAEDGIDNLKSWIRAGKEGKIAVMSPETLAAVRLDKRWDFVRDIKEALLVLGTIKDIYPVGKLAYYMLQSCAGCLSEKDYYELKSKYPFETIATTADALMRHIYNIGPRRWGTYSDIWHFEDFPTCWEHHEAVGEYNGQRCMDYIYFYISRDILLLS
ncbi:hypothetical protein CARUB_v10012450mg [Capsella rubella]|uniref:Uncharacterized protein n=1 Tax=Capsella rubella TaxID=81985 RepID=R0IEN8_9BRAS|nr:hypothetical protein CARUB_v10012450mg [Capsella rubella]